MNSAMISQTSSRYRIVIKPSGGVMGDVYQARERFHPRCLLTWRLDSKVHARISFSNLDQAPSF